MKMYTGTVELGTTGFELVIVPLKGSEIKGRWDKDTDLYLLCHIQDGRCCTFRRGDHYNRFINSLGLDEYDAKNLAKWLETASY